MIFVAFKSHTIIIKNISAWCLAYCSNSRHYIYIFLFFRCWGISSTRPFVSIYIHSRLIIHSSLARCCFASAMLTNLREKTSNLARAIQSVSREGYLRLRGSRREFPKITGFAERRLSRPQKSPPMMRMLKRRRRRRADMTSKERDDIMLIAGLPRCSVQER